MYFHLKNKKWSLSHKPWFSNSYIFAAQCRRPLIFQTMNFAIPNSPSLKYQKYTSTKCKDKGTRKFEFVAKNEFL